ncbi:MAG: hypothetical protein KAS96_11760, partial [Planctomycetes bacterium]|nr:hypothetical protein [Planctomycetota bacterium]
GGSWGASGIVFANNGADLIADMGLADKVTVSYLGTWDDGEATGTNYPFDGRASDGTTRLLSSECSADSYIRNHFGGTDMWCWSAFNDTSANFIFAKNGLGKTWGDMIMITETVDFSTGNYNLYVDGQLYASEGGKIGSFAGLATFTIGRTLWCEMEGKMSDFRIYNRVLSMSEIVDLTNLPGDKLLTVKIDPNFLDSEELVPSVGEHQYYEAWPINLSADELIISCPGIYEFDHWIGDVEDPNSSTTKITLTEDKEVTAVYIAKERVCGDLCHPVLEGDLNGDCYINFVDFALYCEDWGSCTAPECD